MPENIPYQTSGNKEIDLLLLSGGMQVTDEIVKANGMDVDFDVGKWNNCYILLN